MGRFLAGLGFGCITGAITYLISESLAWTIGVGLTTAVTTWVGEYVDLLPGDW